MSWPNDQRSTSIFARMEFLLLGSTVVEPSPPRSLESYAFTLFRAAGPSCRLVGSVTRVVCCRFQLQQLIGQRNGGVGSSDNRIGPHVNRAV